MKLKDSIRKFILANAFEHKGKAQTGAIIGKLISAKIISKDEIKKTIPTINKLVKEINNLTLDKQEKELNKLYPEFFKKEEKKEGLKELPGAKEGKVVTRMPPEPGKYMLSGHAISFLINYLYAKKYKGKSILRFEDTNAEKTKQEYVESFIDGVTRFLKIKPSKTVYISDDIEKMYKEIEKLIKKKKAYVCSCSAEKMSKLRRKREPCEHKKLSTAENLELFKKMVSKKFNENTYTVRLIGDMNSNNAVLRDPVIARINYTTHYRQKNKYCIWPTYDFANTCEDEWCGITHVLRSIDFGEERIELQKYIAKLLGFKEKYYIQYGRFDIQGLEKSSGRAIRALVEKGARWDDPRMPTLAALERRGFVKETFEELAKQVGLSKTPTKIDSKTFSTINRRFIDPIADRYFFVKDPVKINVKGNKKETIKIRKHPAEDHGFRKLTVNEEFYIPKKESKGSTIRLKDYIKINRTKNKEYIPSKNQDLDSKVQKIQWVPAKNNVKIEVILQDSSKTKGLGEESLKSLKEGDIIQFERFGFCKLDKKEKDKLVFMFAHK